MEDITLREGGRKVSSFLTTPLIFNEQRRYFLLEINLPLRTIRNIQVIKIGTSLSYLLRASVTLGAKCVEKLTPRHMLDRPPRGSGLAYLSIRGGTRAKVGNLSKAARRQSGISPDSSAERARLPRTRRPSPARRTRLQLFAFISPATRVDKETSRLSARTAHLARQNAPGHF